MLKTLFTAIFAVSLVLSVAAEAVAQDSPEMKAKQEDTTKMKDTNVSGPMSVTCDPACGFRVVSHDKAEITTMVKLHAKAHHQKELSDADVAGMMKPAGEKKSKDKKKKADKKEKEEQDPHKH